MITRRRLGMHESFEFETIVSLQEHIHNCLDAISDTTTCIATHIRDELDALLIEVYLRASGQIHMGYHSPQGRSRIPTISLQLTWASHENQKRVVLQIRRTDVCPDAHPIQRGAYSRFLNASPWIQTNTPKQKMFYFATVFPEAHIAQRDDLPMAALKRLPALPSEIDIERIHGFWCSPNGSDELLLLFTQNYTYILGTPVGWVNLKNTPALAAAETSKDPWRVLAALGVKIPRLKKNWIWNEAMAAELMMVLLAGETQK
ncbi:MAG: hypothetical protein DDT32_01741 [Syntrophomonadaceae bacterium]|nr:hypothetical protein [Bacillota bacterium]